MQQRSHIDSLAAKLLIPGWQDSGVQIAIEALSRMPVKRVCRLASERRGHEPLWRSAAEDASSESTLNKKLS
jgi:hypothetical protein